MRKYKTTWDEREVNQLARDGYTLHTAVSNNGLIYYVMEWVEPHATATMPGFVYRDPTQIVTS